MPQCACVGVAASCYGKSATDRGTYFLGLQGQRQINPRESRWFWIVLIANPAVWALFCLSALLGLDWGECSRQGYATPHTYCFTHRTAAACQGVGVNASAGTAYMVNASGLPTSQGYKPYSGYVHDFLYLCCRIATVGVVQRVCRGLSSDVTAQWCFAVAQPAALRYIFMNASLCLCCLQAT